MNKKIALVLGTGGARGLAHIGVIRELVVNGYEITSVAGSSMGALIAGVYATGRLDEFEEWMKSLSKVDILNLLDFTLSSKGIIKADKVLTEMQKIIPDCKIEYLPVKYAAVTTDLKNSKEVIIRQGCLYDAIRASISIPLLITPVQQDSNLFVDGGITNPVPVNRVHRTGDDILVAVNVNARISKNEKTAGEDDQNWFEKIYNGKLNGFRKQFSGKVFRNKKDDLRYFSLLTESSSLMMLQIMRLTMQKTPPDIFIEVSRDICGMLDFYKASKVIKAGREAAAKAIRQYAEGEKQPEAG